ncbi:MAG: Undecaprenyl-diphosphatase [Phycisphaerae bacterium]|nr:Undecaprenyl-diphosphatase [Phycisphaerae bacterium]
MVYWQAVILGIVEGLTEFLPISSTGHMIVVMSWLGVDQHQPPWPVFLYFIQIGAILAVVAYFFRPLFQQVFQPRLSHWSDHLLLKLIVGVAPAVVVGLLLDEWAEAHLEKPLPVGLALAIGGLLMLWIERRYRRTEGPAISAVSLRQALLIGLIQCVSIIPGTSRSMATIMGGMIVGLPPATAAQFSFYLAIPTLLGAGLKRLMDNYDQLSETGWGILGVGFVVAAVTAWLAVAGFMRYVQSRPLWPFAFYRLLLAAIIFTTCWVQWR